MSKLEDYLRAPANTTSRESLVAHRALFDFKVAGARRGYDLRVYLPDVDRDGYDVVLEDGDSMFHVQFKATVNASSPVTNIHKGLLRPSILSCDAFGFPASPYGVGLGGGIVQSVLSVSNGELQIEYRYADIRSLLCFHWELRAGPDRDDVDALMNSLQTGVGSERIDIKSGFLVKPRSVDCLLALMGLHSTSDSQWPSMMHALGVATGGRGPRDANDAKPQRTVVEEAIANLIEPLT